MRIFEPEHEQFPDSARRFFQTEIGPHGERWREQGFVDREAFRKAGEQGYLLMWADPKYGGAGVRDFRYEQILIEDAARPIIFHGFAGTCWHPHVKGHVLHQNSIYNNWRFEDVWLER